MNLLSKNVKRAIILNRDPHAFDEGTLLGELEKYEARLSADPDVQRRRAASFAATRKEFLPVTIGSVIFNAAVYGAAAWFLPGLVPPWLAAAAFVLTSALLWKFTLPR